MVSLLWSAVKVTKQLGGWHCAMSHEPARAIQMAGPNGAPPDPSYSFVQSEGVLGSVLIG